MSNDVLDQELRHAMQQSLAAQPLRVDSNPVVTVERRVAGRHTRRVRVRVAVCAGVVVLAGVGGFLVFGGDAAHNARVTTPPASSGPVPSTISDSSGVQVLPTPPLAPRGGAAVVQSGDDVVMWGGYADGNTGLPGTRAAYSDGAAYSIAKGTWRSVASAPIVNPTGWSADGVLTDEGMLFVAGGRSAALYDPTSDTWRRMDDAPRPVFDLVASGAVAMSYSANARLDLRTGQWRDLPTAPAMLDRPTTAWTGAEMVVIGGYGVLPGDVNAMAYDPARDAWRVLPPRPDWRGEALSADWDGRRVVVINYDATASAYDPIRDSWTTLPDLPVRLGEWGPLLRSQGGRSLAFMAAGLAVLDADDRWVPVPYGGLPRYGFSSSRPRGGTARLYVWGVHDGSSVFAVADLERMTRRPPRLQVGMASFATRAGDQLQEALYDGPSTPTRPDAVTVSIAGATGAVCTLTAGADRGLEPSGMETVTLKNGGADTIWYRSADGREWVTIRSPSDTITVQCDRARRARELAESASFAYR